MRTLNKLGMALAALVACIAMPATAFAQQNMVEKELKDFWDILYKFFKPSLVPNDDWWWIYLLVFLPLTFCLFYFAPKGVKKALDVTGRVVIIALIILAIPTAIFFAIGLAVWLISSFIPFLGRFPKIMRVVTWVLRIVIMIGLLRGIALAAIKKETYVSIGGKVKELFKALGGIPIVCMAFGAIFIFGLLNRFEIGTIDDFKVPASVISAGAGVLAFAYFIFRDRFNDWRSVHKTGLTVAGLAPCQYVEKDTGKWCPGESPVDARVCVKCGSPLRFDCECGKPEGKNLSFILDKVCPGCGRPRPPLPDIPHTKTVPPEVYKQLVKERKRRGIPSLTPAQAGATGGGGSVRMDTADLIRMKRFQGKSDDELLQALRGVGL